MPRPQNTDQYMFQTINKWKVEIGQVVTHKGKYWVITRIEWNDQDQAYYVYGKPR